MNWFMALNVVCSEPVPVWPAACDSAPDGPLVALQPAGDREAQDEVEVGVLVS
jgi:hypothetical protein